ncbi:serine/threonine-protein kinase Nek6-like [Arachis stenosperma]|uniref:serine/threonine-protein kinase Nek6-like n=1 Tax=Arachis stenosperma TaxID=217475 RepID=UPI0025AC41F9|nr:serine/threonine-protein kinase Nek6-like [Arachis stenosperma]
MESDKMEDYEVIQQLGRGTLGATFLVLHKTQKQRCVLKKIRFSKQTDKSQLSSAPQEMNLIAKLSSPYIVECKDAWVKKGDYVYIISAYCEGGDMAQYIKKARGSFFPEERVCKWMTQLLLAVDYLHSNRVLHRDLKCSNILLTRDNNIQLGDFGLAKLLNKEDLPSPVIGTPNYMCPELLDNIPYGYKSDIWALGCCMFEIVAHQPALRAPDRAGLINKINRSSISPFPIVYTPTLKQLIKSMLRRNPEHRPTAAELLRHPHLLPYVLRCRNASPVFLPVHLINSSPKDKTKQSPKKSSGGRDHREKQEGFANHMEQVRLIEENAEVHVTNHHNDGKLRVSTSAEDFLETKMVDPTSYTMETAASVSGSKDGSITSDSTICSVCKEADFKGRLAKEATESEITSKSTLDSVNVEQGFAAENFLQSDSVNVTTAATKIEDTLPKPMDSCKSIMSSQDSTVGNDKDDFVNEERSSPVLQPVRLEKDTESDSSLKKSENHDVFTEVSHLDCLSSASNDTLPGKDEGVATTAAHKEGSNAAVVVDKATNGISLSRPTSKGGDGTTKSVLINRSQNRADALEALLELCAQLLKQGKLDELAAVLRPFGEDTVSSRETAIWLTKSLLSSQKFNSET